MSTNPRSFTDKLTNFGLGFWALILIISLLVFGANFIYAGYLNNQENNARGLTADLQVLSQQLAKYTQEAVDGNADAFTEFKATKSRIDSIVGALRSGSEAEGVKGYEGDANAMGVSSALGKVTETWTPMAAAAERITQSEEEVLNLSDTAAQFTARVPRLSFQLDEVVRALSDANAPPRRSRSPTARSCSPTACRAALRKSSPAARTPSRRPTRSRATPPCSPRCCRASRKAMPNSA